jgi:hypothetical protein
MQYIPPSSKRIKRTYLILGAILLGSLVAGLLTAFEDGGFNANDLIGNLSTELIGAVVTFAIIERVLKQGDDDLKLRDQLIRETENPDVGITKRAITELRYHGWLQDGSLAGWFLQRANLEGVYLKDANFQGVGFYRSNLKNTKLTPEQLCKLNDLRLTVMPDGDLYDGRYCLTGDVNWAFTRYEIDLKTATVQTAAAYYGVSEQQYIEGQRWAKQHLHALCGRTPTLTLAAVIDEV